MILVTGAGGKTGETLVSELARGAEPVRALVRREEQLSRLEELGAREALAGDMRDPQVMQRAFQGARAVYHICPNMSPDEVQIAANAITAAKTAGVGHFVYHSVLHPQVEAMPHHWLKMRVEEMLFTCGLTYTILQPGAYMQNVLAYWDAMANQGVYALPYRVQSRLSLVDLADVAEAAANILRQRGHANAIYELAGPEPLSQVEVAEIAGQALGREVEARAIDRDEWERKARASGMAPYAVDTLKKMFEYYEQVGLVGNSRILEGLLGRPARRFSDFIKCIVARGG